MEWEIKDSENAQWDYKIIDCEGTIIAEFDAHEGCPDEGRFAEIVRSHNQEMSELLETISRRLTT